MSEVRSVVAENPTGEAEANILIVLSGLHVSTGQPDSAAQALEPLVASLDRLPPGLQAWTLSRQGEVLDGQGRYKEAVKSYYEALSRSQHCARSQIINAQLLLAETHCNYGHFDRALDVAKLIELTETATGMRAAYNLITARAHNGLGMYREAGVLAAAAADHFSFAQPFAHASALVALADADDGLGDVATAQRHRERALEIFTELGSVKAEELRKRLRRE